MASSYDIVSRLLLLNNKNFYQDLFVEENTCDKKEEEEEEEKEEEEAEEEEKEEEEEDTEIDWKIVLDLIPTTTREFKDFKNFPKLNYILFWPTLEGLTYFSRSLNVGS